MRRYKWASSCWAMSSPACHGFVHIVFPSGPLQVRDAPAASLIAAFGRHRALQVEARGEWKNEIRTDLWAAGETRLQFQGKSARPWLLERRNGPARGINNRLAAGDRFPSLAIFNEAQPC